MSSKRLHFLELDNAHLQREVAVLRAQVDALRERNTALEEEAGNATASASEGRTVCIVTTRKEFSETLARKPTLAPGTVTATDSEPPATDTPATPLPPLPLPSRAAAAHATATNGVLRLALPHVPTSTAPDVPQALAALNLVSPTRARAGRTPEAVASFLSQITATWHRPQSSTRAAFQAAFDAMAQYLPDLPAEWRSGLQRVGQEETEGGASEEHLCWVLLLALAIAALGEAATNALRRLPLPVRMEVLALIPPTSAHAQAVLDFKTLVVQDMMQDSWATKRKLLSLQHGWSE